MTSEKGVVYTCSHGDNGKREKSNKNSDLGSTNIQEIDIGTRINEKKKKRTTTYVERKPEMKLVQGISYRA